MTFLKKSKAINTMLNEISAEINLQKAEFDNVKLDYFVILLYGEFENDLNYVIEKKIMYRNNFGKNYISFLKTNDTKLHRGLKGEKFKELLKKVFGVEVLNLMSNRDWEIFLAFIDFRHSIAHFLKSYDQKKDALTLKIKSTNDLIVTVDNLLLGLDSVSRVRIMY